MGKRSVNAAAPFQSIRDAARLTGLSAFYLRNRCKARTIPMMMVGTEYRINVPLLLAQLERESAENGSGLAGGEDA